MNDVRGRVVDKTGAAVDGALIVVIAGSVPVPEMALVADGEGHFSVRLPVGRFTLQARGGDGSSGTTEVETGSASPEVVVTIA